MRSINATGSHGRRGRSLALLSTLALATLALALPASAAAEDRNRDRIPDRWEKRHNLSLKVKQGRRDQDHDGLRNRGEFKAHMDPRDADSDDDGVEDGDAGTGTIASFDEATGRLRINLIGDDFVSGLVTDDTEIECDNGDDHGDEDGDNSGPSENSGPGSRDHEDEDSSGPSDSSGTGSGDDTDDDADEVEDGDDVDEGDDDVGTDDHRDCSTADLTPGALVQEAELEIEGGSAIWDEVELLVR